MSYSVMGEPVWETGYTDVIFYHEKLTSLVQKTEGAGLPSATQSNLQHREINTFVIIFFFIRIFVGMMLDDDVGLGKVIMLFTHFAIPLRPTLCEAGLTMNTGSAARIGVVMRRKKEEEEKKKKEGHEEEKNHGEKKF